MKKQSFLACLLLAGATFLLPESVLAQEAKPAKIKAERQLISSGGSATDTLKAQSTTRTVTNEEIQRLMEEREKALKGMLNKSAPSFSATDMSGNTYKLEELKGKTVVLNFWFIGCKPCIMEIPHLNTLVKNYGNKEVVFLAFALDEKAALQKFLEKTPFEYSIIPDAGKIARDTYKVSAYPTSIVIDKQGLVKDYLIGYSDDVEEKLTAFIEKAL